MDGWVDDTYVTGNWEQTSQIHSKLSVTTHPTYLDIVYFNMRNERSKQYTLS